MDTPERVLVGQNLLELTVFEAPTVRMLAEKLSPADQTIRQGIGFWTGLTYVFAYVA
jgi:hypothetical protein